MIDKRIQMTVPATAKRIVEIITALSSSVLLGQSCALYRNQRSMTKEMLRRMALTVQLPMNSGFRVEPPISLMYATVHVIFIES